MQITTPYHPQLDGLVERFNRTLLNLLSLAASENGQEWDLHLLMVMLAYCTSVQESTGCTPFYMMFGLEALPADDMYGLPRLPLPHRSISMPWIGGCVWRVPTIGFEKVWDCNINGLPVPPEGNGEPELPQIEFPELPQIEFLNLADQPSRKSNRKHKKPERFGHNIYD